MTHNDPKMNQMQEKRWNIGNGGKKSIFVVGGRSLINVQTRLQASANLVCECVWGVCVGRGVRRRGRLCGTGGTELERHHLSMCGAGPGKRTDKLYPNHAQWQLLDEWLA